MAAQDEKTVAVVVEQGDGKSPLASQQMQLAAVLLVANVVSKFVPTFGAWVKENASTILMVAPPLLALLRHKSDQPIDWKNWTLFGIGKKF